MITTLLELKKHPVFQQLDGLQSQFDNASLQDVPFTRSPYHLLSFLIAYAGLEAADRQQVVRQLHANGLIAQEGLDEFIQEIDWAAILKRPRDASVGFQFNFKLGVPHVPQFYAQIQKNCPQLGEPLRAKTNMVTIESADTVSFITQVSQNVTWQEPFSQTSAPDSYSQNAWYVPAFTTSNAFLDVIKGLKLNQKWHNGVFSVQKGNVENIQLYIKSPQHADNYSRDEKEIAVEPGIYTAFIGLTDFYGIHVEAVLVKLSNRATFSEKGASVEQEEDVDCLDERAASAPISIPTTIMIHAPLHVYYRGADIMVRLDNKAADDKKPSTSPENYFITLATTNQDADVRLYPAQLQPSQVHNLNFDKPVVGVAPNNTPKNSTQAQRIHYAFLLKAGSVLSAAASLSVFTLAVLAIAGIVNIGTAGIGTLITSGVLLAAVSYRLFQSSKESVGHEETSKTKTFRHNMV